MRRKISTVFAVVLAVAVLSPVYALEGTNGHAVDPAGPVVTVSAISYLSEWSGYSRTGLGNTLNGSTTGSDGIALDSTGRLYATAWVTDQYGTSRKDGVIRVEADGSGLETLVQWDSSDTYSDDRGVWNQDGYIRAIDVTHVFVPSTGGVEERLVVIRSAYDDSSDVMTSEVVAYELSAGSDGEHDGEFLFDWETGVQVNLHLATDGATGDLYLLEATAQETTMYDGGIRRFAWSSASGGYVEQSAVTSNYTAYTDLIFLGGRLYTFDADSRTDGSTDTILEVDPTQTDSYGVYAYLKDPRNTEPNGYYGWAKAAGTLYVGEYSYKKRRSGFISPVSSGSTTSAGNAIATFGGSFLYSMVGGTDGSLFLRIHDGIYRVAPTTDGGGGDTGDTGGGGGGKGNGKGKNK